MKSNANVYRQEPYASQHRQCIYNRKKRRAGSHGFSPQSKNLPRMNYRSSAGGSVRRDIPTGTPAASYSRIRSPPGSHKTEN